MSPMPQHVVDHLIASGVLAPGGIGRRARPRACNRCGALTIAGLDDDNCAALARIDPTPLNPVGELTAVLTGRRTYFLTAYGSAYRIDLRWPESITGRPAGTTPEMDVVAAHICDALPITQTAPTRITNLHTARSETTECPF